MYFQRINRTDPEKVFVIAKSAYTTISLVKGDVVSWAYNGTDDGIAVTRPTTALLPLVAGVVAETIANGGYGLLQVYGNNSDTQVLGMNATAVAVGAKLTAQNNSFVLSGTVGTVVAAESGLFILGAASASDTSIARTRKTFVRCM